MSSLDREAELEHALDYIAWVIELHGDVYWPIYLRLEADLENLRSRKAKLKSRSRRAQHRPKRLRPLPQKKQISLGRTDARS